MKAKGIAKNRRDIRKKCRLLSYDNLEEGGIKEKKMMYQRTKEEQGLRPGLELLPLAAFRSRKGEVVHR